MGLDDSSPCLSQFFHRRKLSLLWTELKQGHLLLNPLEDAQPSSTEANLPVTQESSHDHECIIQKVGSPVTLRLRKSETTIWFELASKTASVWSRTVPIVAEQVVTACPPNWGTILFNAIEDALASLEIRISVQHRELAPLSPLKNIRHSFEEGDVLCIKIYKRKALGFVKPYLHYGIYTDSGVIHLQKNKETKEITIRKDPLVAYYDEEMDEKVEKKVEAFVHQKSDAPPVLLFKAVFEQGTAKLKSKCAERAKKIYSNQQKHYFKKYDISSNNCEHFAMVCALGRGYCTQRSWLILTTANVLLRSCPPVIRTILQTIGELAENCLKAGSSTIAIIGESCALGITLIEFAFLICWDWWKLYQTGRLTIHTFLHQVKIRTASLTPELIVALIALLISIALAPTGLPGILAGLASIVLLLGLRFLARPRIQRMIEQQEAARKLDFLQWRPAEVATFCVTDEDSDRKQIIQKFVEADLSGEAISDLISQERSGSSSRSLNGVLETLQLGKERETKLKERLTQLFGTFDINQLWKIQLMYGEQALTIVDASISINELLETARLSWKLDFLSQDWILRYVCSV